VYSTGLLVATVTPRREALWSTPRASRQRVERLAERLTARITARTVEVADPAERLMDVLAAHRAAVGEPEAPAPGRHVAPAR
jgi:hypothetical protein